MKPAAPVMRTRHLLQSVIMTSRPGTNGTPAADHDSELAAPNPACPDGFVSASSLPPGIGAVPVDEARNPVLDRGARCKIHRCREVGDVGVGFHDIAGLYWLEFPHRGATGRGLNHGKQMLEFDRMVVADIVDPPGRRAARRIGRLTRPLRIASRWSGDEPDDRLGHVINIRE